MTSLMNPSGGPGETEAGPLQQAGTATGGSAAAGGPFDSMHHQLDMIRVQYNQLMTVRTMLDKVRLELGNLQKLGDMVTAEDVVRGAGELVSAGASPHDMAALLASMPEGGEALAQWIAGHEQMVTGKEQELEQPLAVMRHELGVAAFRVLAGEHLRPGQDDSGGPAMSRQTMSPNNNSPMSSPGPAPGPAPGPVSAPTAGAGVGPLLAPMTGGR